MFHKLKKYLKQTLIIGSAAGHPSTTSSFKPPCILLCLVFVAINKTHIIHMESITIISSLPLPSFESSSFPFNLSPSMYHPHITYSNWTSQGQVTIKWWTNGQYYYYIRTETKRSNYILIHKRSFFDCPFNFYTDWLSCWLKSGSYSLSIADTLMICSSTQVSTE